MARPLSLIIDGRERSVSYNEAYRLLRTPNAVRRALHDERQLYMWLHNRGYMLSKGDNPRERALRIADHFIYIDEHDPEWRTKIFPAHPRNGTYAIACNDEVLDYTRSFTGHAESWRHLIFHLNTQMLDDEAFIFDPTVFTKVIVPELPIGGTKDYIGDRRHPKKTYDHL